MTTKKTFTWHPVALAGVALLSSAATAQTLTDDSLRVERMQEVVVSGVKSPANAPFAVTNIGKTELQESSRTGSELPHLLARTPGIMAWSENGLGTGTTYMRIRGAADSRINVTLDGVPLNSPEDQCVFWANTNSYASFLGAVQVQRGVGSSTNGDGAFGGTVALQTAAPFLTPRGEVNYSYGSYNTMSYGAQASTGLLCNRFVVDGAWHQTQTDGFVHGTQGRSGSFMGRLLFMPNEKLQLRYMNIGNYEHTGQAWNGVTAGNDALSLMDGTYGATTGINTYKDLYNHGLGKYNSLYERLLTDDDGNFMQDANGNYMTARYDYKNGYWGRTTDNFTQNHNLLTAAWDINTRWSATATLHYTYGYGYYEEFRPQNKLKKFGLANMTTSDGTTLKRDDFVRQKGLEQHAYGAVANAAYHTARWEANLGGAFQAFRANHFGHLTYASNAELWNMLKGTAGRYTYYDSDALKHDGNVYAKAAYYVVNSQRRSASLFADLQYRYVHYETNGINDKFYEADGGYANQRLDINHNYHFLNPKVGLNGRVDNHHYYISLAMSHREPERNNFTDNGSYPAPKAERLLDAEIGYNYEGHHWHAGINGYMMNYKNQFVQTGAVSDIGEALTTNIKRSSRMGVELTAGWDVTRWLTIEGNAALSDNRIDDFDEIVEDWDNTESGTQTIHYDRSTLAFSPAAILNAFADVHWRGFKAVWHTNYVSRQYLDNTENTDRSLPAFTTSNLALQYTMTPASLGLSSQRFLGLREVIFGLNLSNLFNSRHAQSVWVYSAICESAGHPNDNRYYQIGFIPSAGFTAMGSVTIKF